MDLYQAYRKDLLDVHKAIGDHFSELQKGFEQQKSGGGPSSSSPAPAPIVSASITNMTRAQRLGAIAELIQQGKSCLSHMEMEANDLIPAERINVRGELVDHKKKLSKYDMDLVQMRTKAQAAEREELLRGSNKKVAEGAAAVASNPNLGIPDDLDKQSKREREKVAAATEKHRGNTAILANIERIAHNSNETLKDAHGNLLKQRETLTDIGEKTRELDADVSDARRIANQMHKVMVQNKAILLGIIALLVIMIFVIIYVKLSGGSSSSTDNTVIVVLPTSPADGSGNGGGGDGGLPS